MGVGSMRTLRAICTLLALAGAAVTTQSAGAASSPRHVPALPYDFNGDGYPDLAIGAPGEATVNYGYADSQDAGAVHVVYADGRGLTSRGTVLRIDLPGAEFGATMVSADVNRDGYADLIVGSPGRSGVSLIYGASYGLPADRNRQHGFSGSWPPNATSSPPTTNNTATRYGAALALGDFNGDGFPDLASSAPEMPVQHDASPTHMTTYGAVLVRYGSTQGFGAVTELDAVNTGQASDNDRGEFGAALAALPHPGATYDDLVIGWPERDAGGVVGAGAVEIVPGGQQGLDGNNTKLVSLATPGVVGEPQHRSAYSEGDCDPDPPLSDEFGAALVSGDFNGDGAADLAVGIPERQAVEEKNAAGEPTFSAHGAVSVLYGSATTFPAASQLITLNKPGVPGNAEHAWYFGAALAATDFNGDGADDLAIGAPGIQPGPAPGTQQPQPGGLVLEAPGSPHGIRAARGLLLREGHGGLSGRDVSGNLFGAHLAVGQVGRHELLIGAPGRTIHGAVAAGAVVAIPDIAGRLAPLKSKNIVGTTRGIQGSNSTLDAFGHLDGDDRYQRQDYTGSPHDYDYLYC